VARTGLWGARAARWKRSLTARPLLQRLFSTFPSGLPGAGLLLLRAATAIPLLHAALLVASTPTRIGVEAVTASAAILLLIGLWTPLAGGLIAVTELVLALSHPADPWPFVHSSALGAALAMLGPGGCSVDTRLFGRKQIEIPQR
jgi:putative oxidoreductase